jgi:hypothetical protein
MKMSRAALLIMTCVALAACGGGRKGAAPTTSSAAPAISTSSRSCNGAKTARTIRRLQADVAAIRRAASLPTKDTFNGNAAVNRATDRFLADEGRAHVSLLAKNRFIDHAAGALTGSCQQCFQALEAERPIPSISHAGACGS